MASIDHIKKPIAGEMAAFEPKFKEAMKSKVALLDRITHYIVRRKGKQLRPMLVFLTAKMHGEINESTYRGASLIELMHTATLVHDDVVDDANMRRGFFSINALWKNKIAVLVGDYLLSKVLLLAVDNDESQLLQIVSTAVREMSEGELLQIEKARRLDINEDVYFEIIRQKTASLIASCCGVGTASVGADAETVKKMRQFGEWLGIAFQIKDDLFDYESSNKTGKPTGIDIKEQKMTLPLIYALNNASSSDKKRIIRIVKKHHDNPKKVAEVISYVQQSGGIEYATKRMNEYKEKALEILHTYPESEYKTAMSELVDYVIERVK
ncbi:MAG: polyprenyl synthetase family protein [Flavobacteriia bacterium]|nr:polyprenyl synthetase family protein [Flavobacteriia bacterium]